MLRCSGPSTPYSLQLLIYSVAKLYRHCSRPYAVYSVNKAVNLLHTTEYRSMLDIAVSCDDGVTRRMVIFLSKLK